MVDRRVHRAIMARYHEKKDKERMELALAMEQLRSSWIIRPGTENGVPFVEVMDGMGVYAFRFYDGVSDSLYQFRNARTGKSEFQSLRPKAISNNLPSIVSSLVREERRYSQLNCDSVLRMIAHNQKDIKKMVKTTMSNDRLKIQLAGIMIFGAHLPVRCLERVSYLTPKQTREMRLELQRVVLKYLQ